MKITTQCPLCSHESAITGGVTPEKGGQGVWKVPLVHIPISEGFSYPYTCSKGHDITMVLRNFQFEIIFDSGLSALFDGYLREAMTSFYAALEYFVNELSLYFMYLNNIDIHGEQYKKFKPSIRTSERKFGLFYGLYYIIIGEPVPALSNKISEDRNNVIHGSKYPTYEEAVKFGNNIKNYIVSILEKVEAKYSYIDWMDTVLGNSPISLEAIYKRPNMLSYGYLLSSNHRINCNLKNQCITEYKPFWQLTRDDK